MKRFLILISAALILNCLGGIYAWSTFTPSLSAGYGLTNAHLQLIFGVAIAVDTLNVLLGSFVFRSRGPRFTGAFGGLLLAIGMLIAALSGGSFWWLLVGFSILAGAGTGMGYISPLTVCVSWFPNHRGLVSGLAVASFGGGAAVTAWVGTHLLSSGMDVLAVFRVLAICYGLIIFLASLLQTLPESYNHEKRATGMRIADLADQRDFWQLVIGLFTSTFAGLMIIGNLQPLALSNGLSTAVGATAISVFALGNAAGRISWGFFYDRWQDKTLPVALVFVSATVLILIPGSNDTSFFVLTAALSGFAFGSGFVLYPARVATHYGPEAVAVVYPFVFLAYGLSGVLGPVAGGWLFDLTGSYSPALVIAAIIALVGAIFTIPKSRAKSLSAAN